MGSIIQSPLGVLAVLVAVAAFYFWLEQSTRWKIFNYLPPLIWIYITPVILSNTGIIPYSSESYTFLRTYGLPIFIVLMLLNVDVLGVVRIMGKGVYVMLIGSAGVIVGGIFSYALFYTSGLLPEESWKAFGTLAGSWIGGTGNMTAAHAALDGAAEHMTMAAAADQLVYLIWLPILLGSKAFANKFNRWARVPESRLVAMDLAASKHNTKSSAPTMTQLLYLGLLALALTWISMGLSERLPPVVLGGTQVITASTWLILLVTTLGLVAATTPARKLPGAQPIAMAIIYVYVARVGATVDLSQANLVELGWFVTSAYVWISIHGLFILFGAWLFRVDVHTLAIASAANIGGAASAPIVAAHHRESLVPASILMALIGYAIGNYLAILTGRLAQFIGAAL